MLLMYCDFVHFQSPFGFEVAAVTVAVDFAIYIMNNLNKYLNNNLSKKIDFINIDETAFNQITCCCD